jgi:hypothetical protein
MLMSLPCCCDAFAYGHVRHRGPLMDPGVVWLITGLMFLFTPVPSPSQMSSWFDKGPLICTPAEIHVLLMPSNKWACVPRSEP